METGAGQVELAQKSAKRKY